LNLVLHKAVNGDRIYATSEFEMYCVQFKKYALSTNVRVDLPGYKEPKGSNVWVFNCLHD